MKIGFIKKRFSLHGGAERYLETLMMEFRKAGCDVHIFAERWDGETGAVFHRVPSVRCASFLSALSFNYGVCRALRKVSRLDCVISLERTTCQDIYRAGEGCHAEWLEIRSAYEPAYKRASFRINPLHLALLNLEKRLFSATGIIVANSKMVKEQIIKHYSVPAEKITIIYNGVDLDRFNPAGKEAVRAGLRRELGIAHGSRMVLFVGSGFERKGLGTLVEAAARLKRDDITLVIVGSGDDKAYSQKAAGTGFSGRVIFTGPRKDVDRFYAAADLFVLPTLYDPFSNATLEAMASGLPVITTRNNGAAEFLEDGREGYVMRDLADVHGLADMMAASLEDGVGMGVRAREKAAEFPIGKAAEEFLGLVTSLAGPRSGKDTPKDI